MNECVVNVKAKMALLAYHLSIPSGDSAFDGVSKALLPGHPCDSKNWGRAYLNSEEIFKNYNSYVSIQQEI